MKHYFLVFVFMLLFATFGQTQTVTIPTEGGQTVDTAEVGDIIIYKATETIIVVLKKGYMSGGNFISTGSEFELVFTGIEYTDFYNAVIKPIQLEQQIDAKLGN